MTPGSFTGKQIGVAVEYLNILIYFQEILISVLGMENDSTDWRCFSICLRSSMQISRLLNYPWKF